MHSVKHPLRYEVTAIISAVMFIYIDFHTIKIFNQSVEHFGINKTVFKYSQNPLFKRKTLKFSMSERKSVWLK